MVIFSHSANGNACTYNRVLLGSLVLVSFSMGKSEFKAYLLGNKNRLVTQYAHELHQEPKDIDTLFDGSKVRGQTVSQFFQGVGSAYFHQAKKNQHKVHSQTLTELYLKCYELCSTNELEQDISSGYTRLLSKENLPSFKKEYVNLVENRGRFVDDLKRDVIHLQFSAQEKGKLLPLFSDPVQRAYLGDTLERERFSSTLDKQLQSMKTSRHAQEDDLLRAMQGMLALGDSASLHAVLAPLNDSLYAFSPDSSIKWYYKFYLLKTLVFFYPDDETYADIWTNKYKTSCDDWIRHEETRGKIKTVLHDFNQEIVRTLHFQVMPPFSELPFIYDEESCPNKFGVRFRKTDLKPEEQLPLYKPDQKKMKK